MPWTGDVMFSVASPGAHTRELKDPIPYSVEVHHTRYQYTFGLTPSALHDPKRALTVLDALAHVHRVAGNHSRYLYDFAPDAVVLRWTHDPVPRFMYCFEESEGGDVTAEKLVSALRSGDIAPEEVVVGGKPLADVGPRLAELGATHHEGVKEAFADVRARVEGAM